MITEFKNINEVVDILKMFEGIVPEKYDTDTRKVLLFKGFEIIDVLEEEEKFFDYDNKELTFKEVKESLQEVKLFSLEEININSINTIFEVSDLLRKVRSKFYNYMVELDQFPLNKKEFKESVLDPEMFSRNYNSLEIYKKTRI